MNPIRQVIREAHRRSLWQVFGVYLALSWGVYQVVKELTQLFGLPDWVPGFAIVLLLIGLPIVLATAFVQEGGPGKSNEPAAEPIDVTLMPMLATSQPNTPAPESRPSFVRRALFTWQKAVVGGIAAFLLLGITAGGYMGMRNAGVGPFGSLMASGELDMRQPILIAEFTPLNGDTMLATTVTEAFRVDFTQSPSVTVVDRKHVRGVLQRMSREPDSRVDADLAHEIAVRDNIRTYLVGEVSQAGNKYIIAGKLLASKDSRVLASYRETAASEDEIIEAVDRLSKKLRSKIGESLKTIRADKPLELVSTPSMEALQKYTQGLHAVDVQRDFEAGISLLEEAIALDSGFAMAWRKLGVAYANSDGSEDKRRRAILKAYDFRDRLPDIERYNAMGMYYYSLKRDFKKAQNAYEMLVERDPTWPPNNLGIVYMRNREYAKALETFKRTTQIDSTLFSGHLNAVDAYIELGDRKGALKAVELLRRRFEDRLDITQAELWIATAFRDYAGAERLLKTALPRVQSDLLWRSRMNHHAADVNWVNGQLRESQRNRDVALAADVARGNPQVQLQAELWRAAFAYIAERNPARSLEILDGAAARYPLEQFAPVDRPYRQLATAYAMLGKPDRARHYNDRFMREVPEALRSEDETSNDWLNGALALHEGRVQEAIDLWRRRADEGVCRICGDVELAMAFERANMPDSAIARLERYVNLPVSRVIWEDALKLAPAYERLADLYAARGDNDRAARYAGKFVSQWQNADPELQPRVRAKRELLQRLATDR